MLSTIHNIMVYNRPTDKKTIIHTGNSTFDQYIQYYAVPYNVLGEMEPFCEKPEEVHWALLIKYLFNKMYRCAIKAQNAEPKRFPFDDSDKGV